MWWILFVICVAAYMIIDEAVKKHGDLKGLINHLKEVEEQISNIYLYV